MPTLLTPAHVAYFVDYMTAQFLSLYGSTPYGVGDGTFGFTQAAATLKTKIEGDDVIFQDLDLQLALGPPVRTMANYTLNSIFASVASVAYSNLSGYCANSASVSSTIKNLDTFMKWYNYTNGATFWQIMAPPEWRAVFYALTNTLPDAKNLYFAALAGGSVLGLNGSNVLTAIPTTYGIYQKTLPATVNAGYVIDPDEYAGGEAYLKWTGGAGAGAVSISVTGLNQLGVSETWTASGTWGIAPFDTASGEVALTPVTADALITSASALTHGGFTAGTLTVEARSPDSARTYPVTVLAS